MAKKKKDEPAFFAVIPAIVMYDKSLNPYARLLYGALTSLAKKEGYAWASNQYLASLYQVNRTSISHWIKQLQDAGYIRVELIYDHTNRFVEERRIYINSFDSKKPDDNPGNLSPKNNPPEPQDGMEEPAPEEDLMHKYSENCNDSEGGGYIYNHGGYEYSRGVVTDITRGGYEKPRRSLKAINIKAAAADQEVEKLEKPPPEEAEAENVRSLKLHFKNLSPLLIFDEAFYPKAVSYLALHGLDFKFISWMYEFCLKKEPKNLSGYFFRIFFEKRFIELCRSRPPPVEKILFCCPVCSAEHDSGLESCPACGLDIYHRRDLKEIELKKLYYFMPPDSRKLYDEEYKSLLETSKGLDFRERSRQLEDLNRKYGIA